jgi:peptidoglycan/xylan/chitin deacetylase (PgdA/CDA1 family)
VLRDLGIPATVYLPTAIIDGRAPFDWYRGEPPPALGWAEVAELTADGLIEVGSHSRTHPRMPVLGDAEAREELAGSKEEIERRVGREVTSFCYPAGLYSERDARLVIETGYRAGVTCEAGINVFGADLAQLRRTMIVWTDDERRFAAKLAGRLDAPSTLTQAMQRRRAAPHRRPESVRR